MRIKGATGDSKNGTSGKSAAKLPENLTATTETGVRQIQNAPVEKKKFNMNFSRTVIGEKRKSDGGDPGQLNSTGDSTEGVGPPPKLGKGLCPLNLSKKAVAPIKMSLGAQKVTEAPTLPKAKSASVAKAFNVDDESDEEEMPVEAKMRMRNIGRNTPTASGPNSFGKGSLGFCDRRKILQRDMEETQD